MHAVSKSLLGFFLFISACLMGASVHAAAPSAADQLNAQRQQLEQERVQLKAQCMQVQGADRTACEAKEAALREKIEQARNQYSAALAAQQKSANAAPPPASNTPPAPPSSLHGMNGRPPVPPSQ